MPECRLVVLGLSGGPSERTGVGKSSLCFRFVHPSQTEYAAYGEDHQSVMSIADFADTELNNDHFVYFGKARRDYLPSGSDNRIPLSVHVVEQTEFVDDICYRPLGSVKRPYRQRAADDKLRSPGKLSYHCRSTLGFSQGDSKREEFPEEFNTNGVDGYLFALDPTNSPQNRRAQIKLLDDWLEQLPKNKAVAVVVTKCDALSPLMHERMAKDDFDLVTFFGSAGNDAMKTDVRLKSVPGKLALKRKKITMPCFFASSRLGIGVDLPFLYLAHSVLRCPAGQAPRQTCYSKLADERAVQETRLLAAVKGLIRKQVVDPASTWAEKSWELRVNRDFKQYEDIFGEERTKELFCARLVEIVVSEKKVDSAVEDVVLAVAQKNIKPALDDETPSGQGEQKCDDLKSHGKDQAKDESTSARASTMLSLKARAWQLAWLFKDHPDLKAFSESPSRFKRSIRKYRAVPANSQSDNIGCAAEATGSADSTEERSCGIAMRQPDYNGAAAVLYENIARCSSSSTGGEQCASAGHSKSMGANLVMEDYLSLLGVGKVTKPDQLLCSDQELLDLLKEFDQLDTSDTDQSHPGDIGFARKEDNGPASGQENDKAGEIVKEYISLTNNPRQIKYQSLAAAGTMSDRTGADQHSISACGGTSSGHSDQTGKTHDIMMTAHSPPTSCDRLLMAVERQKTDVKHKIQNPLLPHEDAQVKSRASCKEPGANDQLSDLDDLKHIYADWDFGLPGGCDEESTEHIYADWEQGLASPQVEHN